MLNLSPLSLRQLPPRKQGAKHLILRQNQPHFFQIFSSIHPPLQALLSQAPHECVRRYITHEAAQVFSRFSVESEPIAYIVL